MLDNEAKEAPSCGLIFKITERASQAKGGKLDSADDTDTARTNASSLYVATKIAALTVRVTRMENGQSQILRKLESISEKLN